MSKKVIISVISLLMGISSLTYAQDNQAEVRYEGMMKGRMMGGQGMMKNKNAMKAMPSMGGMMMKTMMDKSIVATQDGGVVVLVGNKLMKYDKNLKLVKEAEIKIDMEAMQKNMAEMMKNCPRRQYQMMMEPNQSQGQPAAEAASSLEPGK